MHRRRVLLLVALPLVVAALACLPEQRKPKPFKLGLAPVQVAAAVSLKEALLDFEAYFESENHDIDIQWSFAGSQLLASQILEGTVYDVFISADHIQMERASETGRMGTPRAFAMSQLAIIAPIDNMKVQTPIDLGKNGVDVAMAAEAVPAGSYARQALRELKILSQVLDNIRTNEESVRGVVGKVVSGDVDAGVVYITDVTPAVKDKLRVIPFTGAEKIVPTYELAILEDTKVREPAERVIDGLFGPDGRAALERAGFKVP